MDTFNYLFVSCSDSFICKHIFRLNYENLNFDPEPNMNLANNSAFNDKPNRRPRCYGHLHDKSCWNILQFMLHRICIFLFFYNRLLFFGHRKAQFMDGHILLHNRFWNTIKWNFERRFYCPFFDSQHCSSLLCRPGFIKR